MGGKERGTPRHQYVHRLAQKGREPTVSIKVVPISTCFGLGCKRGGQCAFVRLTSPPHDATHAPIVHVDVELICLHTLVPWLPGMRLMRE